MKRFEMSSIMAPYATVSADASQFLWMLLYKMKLMGKHHRQLARGLYKLLAGISVANHE